MDRDCGWWLISNCVVNMGWNVTTHRLAILDPSAHLHRRLSLRHWLWCDRLCRRGRTACRSLWARLVLRSCQSPLHMCLLQASSSRRAAGEFAGSGRCRMAVVLLPGTMVETGLALISELRRISLCSLVAITRIEGFPHRVRRILGNPSGFDQHISVLMVER